MSILSRYELIVDTYDLIDLPKETMVNVLNQVQTTNPIEKVIKILSLCRLDDNKTQKQIIEYYYNFITQMFKILKYEATEDEITLLTTFFTARATNNIYPIDSLILVIENQDNIPDIEPYRFITLSLKYVVLAQYAGNVNVEKRYNKIRELVNELKPYEFWYTNYINYIEQIGYLENNGSTSK